MSRLGGPLLARMAKAAWAASDWDKADRYAREALQAATVGVFWWTGDAIHQGNIVLGRLALNKLAEWIVLIRGGLKPDFGANLIY